MAATDGGLKQTDTDMADQMTSSELESLQEALEKLGPSEGDGEVTYEQTTETMMVEEEHVLQDDSDPLLQGVVMGSTAEGEVITGDMEDEGGDDQPTYLLVQQPNESSGNESITEARTADGTIIHLRQITTSGTIQGIQGLKPLQPSGIKRQAQTAGGQTVTKVIISGGNMAGGVSQPMVLTSTPSTTQSIKVVSSSPSTSGTTLLPSNSRTITLAQAQQMGLIASPKVQQLTTSPVKQNILLANKMLSSTKVNSSPKITMVQQGSKSPTKILPAPGGSQLLKPAVASVAQINSSGGIGGFKTLMAGPQKVIIRQAGTSLQGALKQGAVLTAGSSSQIIRIPATQNVVGGPGDGQGILQTTRQYLRLVTSPQTSTSNSPKISGATMVPIRQALAPAPVKMVPIAPASSSPGSGIRSVAPKTLGSLVTQKIMIPASNTSTPIRQVAQVSQVGQVTPAAVTQLGGTLVPTAGGNFMVLPAQIYDQLQSTPRTTEVKVKEHKTTPRLVDTTPRSSLIRQSVDSNGIRPRKPCNCTKSQCLKLYCDCFANGEFCNNCNCNTCFNNLEHEEDRQKAIRACLERNPQAFKPKIGKTSSVGDERRHNKGCNCRRSGCLKNYCECYEAKIPCTHMCKCIGCRNVEDNDERKIDRENVVLAAGLRARQQHMYAANRNRIASGKRGRGASTAHHGLTRQPFGFMNQRLVEATCQCLLAQAKQGENAGDDEEEDEERPPMDEAEIERRVLEEYGECLKQFIECSTKLDSTL